MIMPNVKYSEYGATPFQRVMGNHPAITDGWNYLGAVFESKGSLSTELKEQVRRTLAQGNGCEYCRAKGAPNRNQEDEKISVAVAFAEMFMKYRSSINEQTFDVLREKFSELEIIELSTYICFTTASQYFGAIMNLQPEN
jgi:alkylhydroperoxidase family enzyme